MHSTNTRCRCPFVVLLFLFFFVVFLSLRLRYRVQGMRDISALRSQTTMYSDTWCISIPQCRVIRTPYCANNISRCWFPRQPWSFFVGTAVRKVIIYLCRVANNRHFEQSIFRGNDNYKSVTFTNEYFSCYVTFACAYELNHVAPKG